MGSEFSNADMTALNLDNFNYQYLSEEYVDGSLCYKIELHPKNEEIADETGFSKKIVFIDKNIFVQRKALYYDSTGELLKILSAKEFRLVDEDQRNFP